MISNHEEHWALWNQTLGPGVHSTLILVARHRLQEQEEEEGEGDGGAGCTGWLGTDTAVESGADC
jgi:hypothetical protein